MTDKYDQIETLVGSINDDVADAKAQENIAETAEGDCSDILNSASNDIYNVEYLEGLLADMDAEI